MWLFSSFVVLLTLGHFSTTFNSMAYIQIGGKMSRNGRSRIDRPFMGVIAGLSINRLRVLDLVSERDPHVQVRGDVQLVTGVLDRNDLQRMQQVRATKVTTLYLHCFWKFHTASYYIHIICRSGGTYSQFMCVLSQVCKFTLSLS